MHSALVHLQIWVKDQFDDRVSGPSYQRKSFLKLNRPVIKQIMEKISENHLKVIPGRKDDL